MWLRFLAFPLALLAGLAAAGLLAVALVVVLAVPNLPSLDALTEYQPKIPLRIYTVEGVLIGEFGEERRAIVSIAEVPAQLKNAIIAAEDERFYEHPASTTSGCCVPPMPTSLRGAAARGRAPSPCRWRAISSFPRKRR